MDPAAPETGKILGWAQFDSLKLCAAPAFIIFLGLMINQLL